MTDKTMAVSVGDGWNGFWIMIALLAIAFEGKPDVADAVTYHLLGQCPPIEQTVIREMR